MSPHRYLPLLCFALLLIAMQVLHGVTDLALDRAAIANGQWWRLLSGQLVHSNSYHLGLNLAGLCIAWALFARDLSNAQLALIVLITASGSGFMLYHLPPQLDYYLGFSSVLHGLFIAGALQKILIRDHFGYTLLAILLIKLVWDLLFGSDTGTAELIGMPVATISHLWGALSGALAFGLILFCSRRR